MMESIEKLREWVKSLYTPNSGKLKVEGLDIADEIEAEIESRYMELPVDADGVPIHVGDYLESEEYDGRLFPCRGLNVEVCKSGKRWTVCMSYDSYSGTSEYTSARRCRHVKPRTIEDVLRDLVDGIGSVEFDALTAIGEAADEIRELMEVDE